MPSIENPNPPQRVGGNVLSRHVEHKLVEIKEEKERVNHRPSAAK
jgi:hypothetical protein